MALGASGSTISGRRSGRRRGLAASRPARGLAHPPVPPACHTLGVDRQGRRQWLPPVPLAERWWRTRYLTLGLGRLVLSGPTGWLAALWNPVLKDLSRAPDLAERLSRPLAALMGPARVARVRAGLAPRARAAYARWAPAAPPVPEAEAPVPDLDAELARARQRFASPWQQLDAAARLMVYAHGAVPAVLARRLLRDARVGHPLVRLQPHWACAVADLPRPVRTGGVWSHGRARAVRRDARVAEQYAIVRDAELPALMRAVAADLCEAVGRDARWVSDWHPARVLRARVLRHSLQALVDLPRMERPSCAWLRRLAGLRRLAPKARAAAELLRAAAPGAVDSHRAYGLAEALERWMALVGLLVPATGPGSWQDLLVLDPHLGLLLLPLMVECRSLLPWWTTAHIAGLLQHPRRDVRLHTLQLLGGPEGARLRPDLHAQGLS